MKVLVCIVAVVVARAVMMVLAVALARAVALVVVAAVAEGSSGGDGDNNGGDGYSNGDSGGILAAPKFLLRFVGRIGSYQFSYGFSLDWFLQTYVHRVYYGHVRLPTRQELQEPNHPRDVIGSHHGISLDLLLVQRI